MPTRLNVASKPFTNHALPWVIAVSVAFISLIAIVFVIRSAAIARAKGDEVAREINTLNQEEQSTQKQAEEVRQSLTPEQLRSLKSAHELVNRKHFSWSRLFADLEAVLPADVRVSRIAVRQLRVIEGRTVADLELSVVSKSYNTVTDMIGTMQQQGIFQAELHNQNLQKGKGEVGSEYELKVQYVPRAGFAIAPPQPARASLEPAAVTVPGGEK